VETAIRVIERMNGVSDTAKITPVGENAAMILRYMGDGQAAGISPKEVHDMIVAMEDADISADLVRTQLWRMAKRGLLKSKDGRYWRPRNDEAPDAETSEASNTTGPADGSQGGATHLHPEGSIPSGSTPSQDAIVADWED